ncbi:lipoate--protein ligase family protein [Salibacterium halotolerans]|uniref:Octanoyl-[GcvH]:protein N-octanoyltransferase n=1 Tax=Salibacterium halotolerans TaxID=1884432 RepID=A0A1I5U123_9BACI|nr:lipoate--protein ligase family protein [Salibacterium halotolerans]SFP88974.1 octanoyl-[GcvH]:protein N-octanoyltransferase [Salibacterium halotolerans]
MNMNDMFHGIRWRWIDHAGSGLHFHPLQSFAYDDTFCVSAGAGLAPVMRAWVHSPVVVLGIQDSRLPSAADGIDLLREQGYQVIVRNSGGLAVVLDEGIFNLSFIFKENKQFSIHSGYELMWEAVRRMFPDAPASIDAYEVKGSYCPGDYDLSINGRKFAGISQRRIRGGAAVQIYMAVHGSGAKRARLLKQFYETAAGGDHPPAFEPPRIEPQVMASLAELYDGTFTINDVLYRLLTTVKNEGAFIDESRLEEDEQERFDMYLNRVMERNDKALRKTKQQNP